MAQMVEHILGKDEVTSSILVSSSKIPHNSVGFLLIYYYATCGCDYVAERSQYVPSNKQSL